MDQGMDENGQIQPEQLLWPAFKNNREQSRDNLVWIVSKLFVRFLTQFG